jgi:hypothetical protein
MDNPKRARSGSSESPTEGKKAEEAAAPAADMNQLLRQVHQSYWEAVQAAYANAQKECAEAVFGYLGAVQGERDKAGAAASSESLKDAWQQWGQQGQVPADVYRKYWLGNFDQQASAQKAMIDAATQYSEALRSINNRFYGQIGEQNAALADALKDALLRADARPADIPVLATLYHAMRTMEGPKAA